MRKLPQKAKLARPRLPDDGGVAIAVARDDDANLPNRPWPVFHQRRSLSRPLKQMNAPCNQQQHDVATEAPVLRG